MALYEQLGKNAVWSSETSAEDTVVRLVAQNNGNLVIYNTAGISIWASDTSGRCRVDGKVL